MELTKEAIRDPDALWKWIRKEAKAGNIEHLKLESLIDDIPIDNSPFVLKHVRGRVLTITLGPEIDYSDLVHIS